MANNVISNIFRIPDLRKKIFFTMFILVVYRIGAHIPIPGINLDALEAFFAQASQSSAGGLLNFFDLFAGGALKRVTIFALGIMPYISASIILQLLAVVIPALEKMKKESDGHKKIQKFTKYLTVCLCLFQSFGIIAWLRSVPEMQGKGRIVPVDSIGFIILAVIAITTGTMVLVWLGEIITERGIGNGISLIIFAGIVVRLPQSLFATGQKIISKGEPIMGIVLIGTFMFIVAASILITLGRRNIPLQYGKRQVGGHAVSAPAQTLPMPINPGNVIPIIFASSILMFPNQILNIFSAGNASGIASKLQFWLAPGQAPYLAVYALMVIFFCYFYATISFNPHDVSENLKRYQGFIPGIRPGQNTEDYLSRTLNRVLLFGSLFLVFIAISPDLILKLFPEEVDAGMAYNLFGGTSLLIIVGVALDTLKQIESQLLMRHYDGFFKDVRLKSRRMN
jgi:preprotein translocase subunit SecY